MQHPTVVEIGVDMGYYLQVIEKGVE